MATPLNSNESLKVHYFNATHYISVYLGNSIFNAVWKVDEKDKTIKQFYADLPACEQDVKDMEDCLKRFQFTKPMHTHKCKNPKRMDFLKVLAQIKKHLARNPQENSLIFYCLAGHGMVEAGE